MRIAAQLDQRAGRPSLELGPGDHLEEPVRQLVRESLKLGRTRRPLFEKPLQAVELPTAAHREGETGDPHEEDWGSEGVIRGELLLHARQLNITHSPQISRPILKIISPATATMYKRQTTP